MASVLSAFKLSSSSPLLSLDHASASLSSPSSSSVFKYRPAVILPGLGNNSSDYQKLELTLRNYGVETVVAKVSRYLKRVDEAVQEAKELSQGCTLSLIGHSAGGWLARIYMEDFGISHISLLLTLGTPHLPPPKGLPGVIDQTRGLLNYVEKHCSKAVYTSQLKYVCIAGRYIQGAPFFGSSNANVDNVLPIEGTALPISESDGAVINNTSTSTSVSTTTLRARIVGQGYKQVCGEANVWGDGVVPQASAHLDGALNISLDGVYHSPLGSDDASKPWYGSPDVVEQWIHHLLN
ncbi:uncharacterized protein LOC107429114 isoform X2 [Ziziphus jujuba]|uniref:GPI inositol-deacylase n=1 Tax=Ziziphus jujuba TaxID=326968 RepID=A0A6P4AJS1_ZIZJJ|nr:uncharacterized protein LOC107429114 isoform X2 [Ziziphus jujuba]